MSILDQAVKSIYIAVLNCGEARVELMRVLLHAVKSGKYKIAIDFPHDKPISNNRNKIVKKFLSMKDYDYLLMIDSDIVPPLNFLDLVDYDVDIITPIMFAYRAEGIVPLALEKNNHGGYNVIGEQEGKDYADAGLLRVDATGTGCMFIKRKVLEDPRLRAPFLDEFDEDGVRKLGLDLSFCKRAIEAGYKVYVHTDFVASHIVGVDLKDVYVELMERNRKGLGFQQVGTRNLKRSQPTR